MLKPEYSMDVAKAKSDRNKRLEKRKIFIVSPSIFMKYTREKYEFQPEEFMCDTGHKKKRRRSGEGENERKGKRKYKYVIPENIRQLTDCLSGISFV
jgi:hypothetical protein